MAFAVGMGLGTIGTVPVATALGASALGSGLIGSTAAGSMGSWLPAVSGISNVYAGGMGTLGALPAGFGTTFGPGALASTTAAGHFSPSAMQGLTGGGFIPGSPSVGSFMPSVFGEADLWGLGSDYGMGAYDTLLPWGGDIFGEELINPGTSISDMWSMGPEADIMRNFNLETFLMDDPSMTWGQIENLGQAGQPLWTDTPASMWDTAQMQAFDMGPNPGVWDMAEAGAFDMGGGAPWEDYAQASAMDLGSGESTLFQNIKKLLDSPLGQMGQAAAVSALGQPDVRVPSREWQSIGPPTDFEKGLLEAGVPGYYEGQGRLRDIATGAVTDWAPGQSLLDKLKMRSAAVYDPSGADAFAALYPGYGLEDKPYITHGRDAGVRALESSLFPYIENEQNLLAAFRPDLIRAAQGVAGYVDNPLGLNPQTAALLDQYENQARMALDLEQEIAREEFTKQAQNIWGADAPANLWTTGAWAPHQRSFALAEAKLASDLVGRRIAAGEQGARISQNTAALLGNLYGAGGTRVVQGHQMVPSTISSYVTPSLNLLGKRQDLEQEERDFQQNLFTNLAVRPTYLEQGSPVKLAKTLQDLRKGEMPTNLGYEPSSVTQAGQAASSSFGENVASTLGSKMFGVAGEQFAKNPMASSYLSQAADIGMSLADLIKSGSPTAYH